MHLVRTVLISCSKALMKENTDKTWARLKDNFKINLKLVRDCV